jgi:hypothetical protein
MGFHRSSSFTHIIDEELEWNLKNMCGHMPDMKCVRNLRETTRTLAKFWESSTICKIHVKYST